MSEHAQENTAGSAGAAGTPSDPPEAEFQRFHPLTPLIAGWKTLAVIVAIVSYQGIDGIIAIIQHGVLTVRNVGIGALIGVALLILSVVVGWLMWRATKFAITNDGVFVRVKFLSTSRRVAPRERIDSVSIERPILARIVGLSKVRVELTGGGDSHIDLEYVSRARAEDIYTHILDVARGAHPEAAGTNTATGTATDTGTSSAAGAAVTGTAAESASAVAHDGEAGTVQMPSAAPTLEERARSLAYDGDGEGRELARIPTTRVLHSMVRDADLWIMLAVSIVFGLPFLVWQVYSLITGGEFSIGALVGLLPALLAAPRWVFERVESGWGFISRATESGIRARRGLLNSRSDSLSAFRIQSTRVRQPLLWRAPGWIEVKVKTAGMDNDDDASSPKVLPVGTQSEAVATLEHVLPPLGALVDHPIMHAPLHEGPDLSTLSETDLILAYLTLPLAQLPGARPVRHWTQPIASRTHCVALTDNVVLVRSGWLAHKVDVIPRERLQNVELSEGPLARRARMAQVSLQPAHTTISLRALAIPDALSLFDTLAEDAGTHRRYANRESWAAPRLRGLHPHAEAPVA